MRTTITVCILACGLGLSIPAPDAAASEGSSHSGGSHFLLGDGVVHFYASGTNFLMSDGSVRFVNENITLQPGPFAVHFRVIAGQLAGDVVQAGRILYDGIPFATEGACSRIDREGDDLLIGGDGYDVLSAWDGTSATFRATGKESGGIRAAHPDDPGCILVGRIAP